MNCVFAKQIVGKDLTTTNGGEKGVGSRSSISLAGKEGEKVRQRRPEKVKKGEEEAALLPEEKEGGTV